MSDESSRPARPLIGFITGANVPPIVPAPTNRAWMSATRGGWANRCLPLLIANQSGWELRNPSAFTATWMGGDGIGDLMIAPDRRGPGQFLPASNFGYGILTWHLPLLFRTPAGWDLLVRGPANHPKDAISPLEGMVETDWASSSFSMNWKFTRPLMPVRFEVDEPICMIVPQRRTELEEFAPELRPIESDDDLRRKHEVFLHSRREVGQAQAATNTAAGERVPWQGDYTRGSHADGEAGPDDHRTRRVLRPFIDPQREEQHQR
ncbi:DUF6065 family protein [Mycobacterium cookii]|uniref:Uncharacterized protein n=1 Tax=Mycobacterium cookii TaxID=1775 RepID=A0A7I7KR39_9MYCO|nr:DUF6065 family protein [Mycobacterium cookii]MCV7332387.1 hypothetical protein [Mycobacterium cookii]BBX44413.1 hypothetical protein MCOO_04280 [Mycobacterium cookii]